MRAIKFSSIARNVFRSNLHRILRRQSHNHVQQNAGFEQLYQDLCKQHAEYYKRFPNADPAQNEIELTNEETSEQTTNHVLYSKVFSLSVYIILFSILGYFDDFLFTFKYLKIEMKDVLEDLDRIIEKYDLLSSTIKSTDKTMNPVEISVLFSSLPANEKEAFFQKFENTLGKLLAFCQSTYFYHRMPYFETKIIELFCKTDNIHIQSICFKTLLKLVESHNGFFIKRLCEQGIIEHLYNRIMKNIDPQTKTVRYIEYHRSLMHLITHHPYAHDYVIADPDFLNIYTALMSSPLPVQRHLGYSIILQLLRIENIEPFNKGFKLSLTDNRDFVTKLMHVLKTTKHVANTEISTLLNRRMKQQKETGTVDLSINYDSRNLSKKIPDMIMELLFIRYWRTKAKFNVAIALSFFVVHHFVHPVFAKTFHNFKTKAAIEGKDMAPYDVVQFAGYIFYLSFFFSSWRQSSLAVPAIYLNNRNKDSWLEFFVYRT